MEWHGHNNIEFWFVCIFETSPGLSLELRILLPQSSGRWGCLSVLPCQADLFFLTSCTLIQLTGCILTPAPHLLLSSFSADSSFGRYLPLLLTMGPSPFSALWQCQCPSASPNTSSLRRKDRWPNHLGKIYNCTLSSEKFCNKEASVPQIFKLYFSIFWGSVY
jgi:hypothetical protein